MGFRFRKSIGCGPLRINLSKSGIGYSIGTKGFRYTKKAGGGTRSTVSIPGTGISYSKDYRQRKRGSKMKQSHKLPSKANNTSVLLPQLQTLTLKITGINLYIDNIKKLVKPNPDWKLSDEEIFASNKHKQKIYQFRFICSPLELIPDSSCAENPNAIAVVIEGNQIGYLDHASSKQVRMLLKSKRITSVSCGIIGGKYKTVDGSGTTSVHSSPINGGVKIIYREESGSIPSVANLPAKTNKAKKKKPIHKRWWFWLILIAMLSGSCNKGSNTPAEETIPPETTTSIIESHITSTVPSITATTAPNNVESEPSTETAYTEPTTTEVVPTIPVETTEAVEPAETEPAETEKKSTHYVLNKNSKIFHYASCYHADRIKDTNREDFYGSREEVLSRNFKPCGTCHP